MPARYERENRYGVKRTLDKGFMYEMTESISRVCSDVEIYFCRVQQLPPIHVKRAPSRVCNLLAPSSCFLSRENREENLHDDCEPSLIQYVLKIHHPLSHPWPASIYTRFLSFRKTRGGYRRWKKLQKLSLGW